MVTSLSEDGSRPVSAEIHPFEWTSRMPGSPWEPRFGEVGRPPAERIPWMGLRLIAGRYSNRGNGNKTI